MLGLSSPAGLSLSQLSPVSFSFFLFIPFFLSPIYIQTNYFPFSRKCNLFIVLYLRAFSSYPFILLSDNCVIQQFSVLLTSLSSLFVSLEPRFLRILNPVANCNPTRHDRNGEITPRAPSVNK